MFDKILIANRGEIACRIIKTARAMGVRTVAVYSDADADALHVAMADEAVRLGPAPVAESYLRGDLIIAAAQAQGAQAIHPGYGFLSENPDFVDAVTAAGLTFIGPSATAIRAMGLKDAAKALMHSAGVPVVPGYHGAEQDSAFLAARADEIGYPVLIKAVAGGGGKGMRLVEDAADFHEHLDAARSEALSAFGNEDVLIERYITSPRHIEVQIFGDGTRAVHLFERDCSLQRRHQKVIEEAPAPGMTAPMRAAMGQAAVTAATAIGYAGAGTVEFIVDGAGELSPDRFWFMEMNTRLQVEHPVTEAVTGIDLVAWQLQVAAGDALPCAQDDIRLRGHAFEARLYAEDVPAGFLPATGKLSYLEFPPDARVDSGVRQGDEISPWYDPMIAKITTHGDDRASALRALRAALDGCAVAGTVTNISFLRRLVRERHFSSGDVDTGLIARHAKTLVPDPKPSFFAVAQAALAVACPAAGPLTGFALWQPLRHQINLLHGETRFDVMIQLRGPDICEVSMGDTTQTFVRRSGTWGARTARYGSHVTVFGEVLQSFAVLDPLARETQRMGGDTVVAPMPGLVQSVAVRVGDKVKQGDRLLVLEAMKMEHVLRAPRDGVIAQLHASPDMQVTAQLPLVLLEPV